MIMADPPWEIHQELPYGTMGDEEMRNLNIGCLQDDGVIFLWVTGSGSSGECTGGDRGREGICETSSALICISSSLYTLVVVRKQITPMPVHVRPHL